MNSKFRVSIILAAGLMVLAAFFLLRLPSRPDSLAQIADEKVPSVMGSVTDSPFVSRQAVAFGESVAVRDLAAAGIATTLKGYKFKTVEDQMEEVRIQRENQTRALKGLPPLTEGQKEDREKNGMNTERIKIGRPGKGNARRGSFLDEALSLSPAVPSVMPTPAVNFEGMSSADNTTTFGSTFAPPDTVGDVGPNHYVQMDNSLVGIYDKTGTLLVPKFRLTAITSVAGGPCATVNDGDPIVLYDPLADRWLMSQFCTTPVPGHQIIAISKTPDPTGAYYVYDFVHPTDDFQDYPHLAVWPTGYFMSTNQFDQTGRTFKGTGAFAYDRVKMLAGDPTASYVYVNEFSSICPSCGGQLPTDIDGTVTPPVGSPDLFMEFRSDEFGDPVDGLRIFAFTPNFTTPASSTFVQVGTDLPLAAFDGNSPSGRNVVEQPGTTTGLDVIADRLMHRIGYRNLGTVASPVNSYVLNFTVNVGGAAATSAATYQAGIRWAELRRGGDGTMSVNQQGTQSTNPGNPAGGTNLWLGSAAQDNAGGIFLGYSTSGSTDPNDFPSIKYAGRLASDPPGTLAQGEATGILGTGSQNGAGSRWGDYSAASVDPADECSFWYTQEYRTAANTGNAFNWTTRVIGGIKLPGCTAPQRGTISGTITNCGTGQPIAGASVTSTGGFATGTNAAGQYTFINVPVGTTGVAATNSGGFNGASNNGVVVTNAGNTSANLCLTAIPVLSGGTATIVSESCLPANGVIDPGETVTLAFPVSNTGTVNTVNDIGTLQATGGVTSPGASQPYGVITAGGPAITRNITFTASPQLACGTNITATVAHVDGANNLGNIVYTIPTGVATAPTTVSYTSPEVSIPDNTTAGVNVPLVIGGVAGAIADVNFRIDGTASSNDPLSTTVGLNHSFVGDLKFKLTSPQGTTVEIMSAGGGDVNCAVNNIYQMTLDDQATSAQTCPSGGTNSGPLTGSFTPSNPLSAFNGQNPNGTWTLNVIDTAAADTGSIRAYSLIITGKICCGGPPPPTPTPVPTATPTPTPTPVPTPTPTPTACAFSNGGLNPQSIAENGVVSPTGTFWSEVQHNTGVTTLANASSGFAAVQGTNRLTDNFTLTQPCTLNSVNFYGYLTGAAATPSPFTAYTLRIWNGRPGDVGSTVIFGDTTTNRLASSVNSNLFRLFNSVVPTNTPPGTTRRIWRNTVTVGTLLPAGTYWLDWASTVTGNVSHFHPSKTIAGSRGVAGDNARQFDVATAVWVDLVDAGTPATNPGVPQDMPFDINGVFAAATLSGQIFTSDGTRGLRNAIVSLTDANGIVQTATTSSFGFYSFGNVAVGGTYTIRVSSRLFRFAARTVTVNGDLTDINLVGQE